MIYKKRCDPTIIDEGIREFVLLLWGNGFDTWSSCQGGEGHQSIRPTVTITPNETETIDELLIRLGFFLLKSKTKWRSIATDRTSSFIYLRLEHND